MLSKKSFFSFMLAMAFLSCSRLGLAMFYPWDECEEFQESQLSDNDTIADDIFNKIIHALPQKNREWHGRPQSCIFATAAFSAILYIFGSSIFILKYLPSAKEERMSPEDENLLLGFLIGQSALGIGGLILLRNKLQEFFEPELGFPVYLY